MKPFRIITSLIHQVALMLGWLVSANIIKILNTDKTSNEVLFVASDTDHLIGARGDEAMLQGAIGTLLGSLSSTNIHIACSSQSAKNIADRMGFKHFDVWGSIFMPFVVMNSIIGIRPKAGFFMGADIMDGHYSPVHTLRMLIASDLLARYGASSRFLGFSLNTNVPYFLRLAFRSLDKRVQVNLRDPLSFERHRAIAGVTGNLVADTAFLLKPALPGDIAKAAIDWVAMQRSKGQIVLGINFHPMLFAKNEAAANTQSLARSVVKAMEEAQTVTGVSWLLVPHDDRVEAGDMSTLEMLEAQLPAGVRSNSYRIVSPPSAGELKTIAGALDGVITGRMHLAIAALGQGVPVLTFAYQGKFEGLMKHFAFPDWVVVRPIEVLGNESLVGTIKQFISALPELKTQLDSKLPAVLNATRSTFKGLQ